MTSPDAARLREIASAMRGWTRHSEAREVEEIAARLDALEGENDTLREMHVWAKPVLPEVLATIRRAVSKHHLTSVVSARVSLMPTCDAMVLELRAALDAAPEGEEGGE